MPVRRSELMKILAEAEKALAEAASVVATIPEGYHAEYQALEHLAEMQNEVRRIEQLLNQPDDF